MSRERNALEDETGGFAALPNRQRGRVRCRGVRAVRLTNAGPVAGDLLTTFAAPTDTARQPGSSDRLQASRSPRTTHQPAAVEPTKQDRPTTTPTSHPSATTGAPPTLSNQRSRRADQLNHLRSRRSQTQRNRPGQHWPLVNPGCIPLSELSNPQVSAQGSAQQKRTGTAIARVQQVNRALDCSLEPDTEQLINDLLGAPHPHRTQQP